MHLAYDILRLGQPSPASRVQGWQLTYFPADADPTGSSAGSSSWVPAQTPGSQLSLALLTTGI